MKIAVSGPATLSMLQDLVDQPIKTAGYPFPATSELVRQYIGAGHHVVLVTTGQDLVTALNYSGPNLDIKVVPARSRARARALDFFRQERRGVLEAIKESQPDVVHGHWTYEFGLAARKCGIPNLVTVHDWAPSVARQNKHLYWYFRAVMQAVCLLLPGATSAPTCYIADHVRRTFRRKCDVIPNGVVLDALPHRPAGESAYAVGMLNVGFSELKNVATALRAWKIVRQSHPTATLFLAGPDYQQDGPAHTWAILHNCAEGVVFEGPVEPAQRASWYAGKRLFLHPSREESFGLVLVEAMAAMVPVIAGKSSGAIPEVTAGAAQLIDIESPAGIAKEVARLLDDEAARTAMVESGRIVALRYDLPRVAERYLELLEGLRKPKA